RPNVSLTLVRNPYFRQWSYAAQPAGYPDVIRIEYMAGPGKQQAAVAAGRADLVEIMENGQPYDRLAVRYPTRLHPAPPLLTHFPFSHPPPPPVPQPQGPAGGQLRHRPCPDYADLPRRPG